MFEWGVTEVAHRIYSATRVGNFGVLPGFPRVLLEASMLLLRRILASTGVLIAAPGPLASPFYCCFFKGSTVLRLLASFSPFLSSIKTTRKQRGAIPSVRSPRPGELPTANPDGPFCLGHCHQSFLKGSRYEVRDPEVSRDHIDSIDR